MPLVKHSSACRLREPKYLLPCNEAWQVLCRRGGVPAPGGAPCSRRWQSLCSSDAWQDVRTGRLILSPGCNQPEARSLKISIRPNRTKDDTYADKSRPLCHNAPTSPESHQTTQAVLYKFYDGGRRTSVNNIYEDHSPGTLLLGFHSSNCKQNGARTSMMKHVELECYNNNALCTWQGSLASPHGNLLELLEDTGVMVSQPHKVLSL